MAIESQVNLKKTSERVSQYPVLKALEDRDTNCSMVVLFTRAGQGILLQTSDVTDYRLYKVDPNWKEELFREMTPEEAVTLRNSYNQ